MSGTDVIIGSRRAGKTAALVAWYRQAPDRRVIVCHDQRTADHLITTLRLPSDAAVGPDRVHERLRGRGFDANGPRRVELGIDNLDMVLQAMFGNVVAATSTQPWHTIDLDDIAVILGTRP